MLSRAQEGRAAKIPAGHAADLAAFVRTLGNTGIARRAPEACATPRVRLIANVSHVSPANLTPTA